MTERAVNAVPIPREFCAGIGIASCGDVTVAWAYRAHSARGRFSEGVIQKRVFGRDEVSEALPAHLSEHGPIAVYLDAGDAGSPVASIAKRTGKLITAPSRLVTRSELRNGCEEILAHTKEHPGQGDLLRVAHRMLWRDLDMATPSGQFAVGMLLAIYALRTHGKSESQIIEG